MAYKALYNKYRPQTFEEVAGQGAIVRTLRNAINSGKIAHAYLFCGPRGTGKTSMARLFAKALNCEEGVGHQCCHCPNCEQLATGSHPDVIEIDAASNNGVDQVRELIEQVRYAPIRGRYKIYIIDEVHMMSQGAFNALLKTLEEPPEHVIFILATTEPHKVLPTILSRCQRYEFGKIDDSDLAKKLVWVLNQENVAYEEAGLQQIVELADGGMRDALSILDQALAYGGSELTEKDVLTVFGLTSLSEKVSLLKTIASGDVVSVLKKLSDFFVAGVDIRRLSSSLLDILKDLLIFERTHEESLLQVLKKHNGEELSEIISVRKANQMIEVLLRSQRDFKTVSNVRSLFELTLLQLASLFGESEEIVPEPVPVPAPKPVERPKETAPVTPSVPVSTPPEPKKEPPVQAKPSPLPTEIYTGTSVPSFLDGPDGPIEEETPRVPPSKPNPPVPPPAPKQPEPVKMEETPKKNVSDLDLSNVPTRPLVKEGSPILLGEQEFLKIMVLGQRFREERKKATDRWGLLSEAALDPRVGKFAQLFADGKPFCLCKEVLILSYTFKPLADQVNYRENNAVINAIATSFFGRPMRVFAIDGDSRVKFYNLFYASQQAGTLPKEEEIELNLPR
ncbi:MAG: DNA polymerase III subunit gamma/tau [Candidatus Enteromonas sp.]|nr:DNA polymerase III subunit gamma/tau [Candidatus Enteromonas sp.]